MGDICTKCGLHKTYGQDFAVGLGPNGLLPSYIERPICRCKDTEADEITFVPMRENEKIQEYSIPFSFINWKKLWARIRKKS